MVTSVGFNQKPISKMDRFVGSIYIQSIRVPWVSEIPLSGLKQFSLSVMDYVGRLVIREMTC